MRHPKRKPDFVLKSEAGFIGSYWVDSPNVSCVLYRLNNGGWKKGDCSKLKVSGESLKFSHNGDYWSDFVGGGEGVNKQQFLSTYYKFLSDLDSILLGENSST